MVEKTCAACDCNLDANSIKVKIGGKTVEVCCEECSHKLKEASVSATAAAEGGAVDGNNVGVFKHGRAGDSVHKEIGGVCHGSK